MIDIDENEELANTYNIKSIPTFLFIHKNELKDQCSGMILINFINYKNII